MTVCCGGVRILSPVASLPAASNAALPAQVYECVGKLEEPAGFQHLVTRLRFMRVGPEGRSESVCCDEVRFAGDEGPGAPAAASAPDAPPGRTLVGAYRLLTMQVRTPHRRLNRALT